jgi:hypothetical protein
LALVPLPNARASSLPPIHLTLRGVLGEPISFGAPDQARTTIVFIMSRRAQDESSNFGREVDERTLDADVESVAVIDMRRYGGWLRNIAVSRLRKAAEESLARRRARRLAHSRTLDEEAIKRWHLVGDFDGALLSRFAVTPDPDHPLAFVLDRRGAPLGPFRQVADVLAAVAGASGAMPR